MKRSKKFRSKEPIVSKMLTIFTIPKAFEGHIGIIQRNAIGSWSRLGCDVILCGDDPGVSEAAKEVGATHIPDIDRNDYGTPLLSSAFAKDNVRVTERHKHTYTHSERDTNTLRLSHAH